ncbi:hypothetical protein ElyMa_001933800 [Elysia marginata]|uniref:Uncharacterized protein n=1 Tax=Elysia marginata TaxID=1093978 RepID=A0AAV4EVR1_9GAST|nr:hypothetical protein ElyMa_001933800 [Elysia marginata]
MPHEIDLVGINKGYSRMILQQSCKRHAGVYQRVLPPINLGIPLCPKAECLPLDNDASKVWEDLLGFTIGKKPPLSHDICSDYVEEILVSELIANNRGRWQGQTIAMSWLRHLASVMGNEMSG